MLRVSGASFLYRGGDDRRGGPQGGRQVNNQRNQWDGGKHQNQMPSQFDLRENLNQNRHMYNREQGKEVKKDSPH